MAKGRGGGRLIRTKTLQQTGVLTVKPEAQVAANCRRKFFGGKKPKKNENPRTRSRESSEAKVRTESQLELHSFVPLGHCTHLQSWFWPISKVSCFFFFVFSLCFFLMLFSTDKKKNLLVLVPYMRPYNWNKNVCRFCCCWGGGELSNSPPPPILEQEWKLWHNHSNEIWFR